MLPLDLSQGLFCPKQGLPPVNAQLATTLIVMLVAADHGDSWSALPVVNIHEEHQLEAPPYREVVGGGDAGQPSTLRAPFKIGCQKASVFSTSARRP